MSLRVAALVGLAAWALLPAPALAADDAEGWSYGLWNELMSPFCPGRTLADCPSTKAEELRIWIVGQEDQGRDREKVVSELFETFGDVLRQAPAAEGIGLAAYVIPILAFLAGGGLIALFLKRQSGPSGSGGSPPLADVDPELKRRLDEEIAG